MDIHTVIIFIVIVSVVGIDSQHGENTDQLNTLAQAVGNDVWGVHLAVIGRQRQDTPGHGVHNILGRRFHNHIPGKIRGKGAALCHDLTKLLQLFFCGHFAKEQKIRCIFKSKSILPYLPYKILHIVAPVPQLAVTGGLYPIHVLEGDNFGNGSKPGQHTFSTLVAQSPVNPIFFKQAVGNTVVFPADGFLFYRIVH